MIFSPKSPPLLAARGQVDHHGGTRVEICGEKNLSEPWLGLACGRVPIVSRRGGLVEAIAPYGFTFENGDAADLAACYCVRFTLFR